MTISEKKKVFNRIILHWYKKNRRSMTWRETCDPYKILVSEIMLQQTQVDRVRKKYDEFLKAFPDVATLARASRADVLRVWSGLGYNRRALYLHECAKTIVKDHAGKFPNTYDALIALPGIGRSTAGALLAFVFDRDVPMIDTNIRRILVRIFYKGKNMPNDKALYEFASDLIPKGRGRVWNYALLDIGATLCRARGHSLSCPLMQLHGRVGDFVYKKPQQKFLGSRRYFRGQLLRMLVEQKSVSMAQAERELKLSESELHEVIEALKSERIIVCSRDRFRLARS